jgi:hypothetical protein
MIEIHYRVLEDGDRIRLWQSGWAPDAFETMDRIDFQKFKNLAFMFSIRFIDKTYED